MLKILDYFTDGDLLLIAVSEQGRFCYLCENIREMTKNDSEVITKKSIREYLAEKSTNIPALPHIEDASPALRYLYYAVMKSENNMYFAELPEEDGWSDWESIGLSKEKFTAQIKADIKKYSLEDVIACMKDGAAFTCYDRLQSCFTIPASSVLRRVLRRRRKYRRYLLRHIFPLRHRGRRLYRYPGEYHMYCIEETEQDGR